MVGTLLSGGDFLNPWPGDWLVVGVGRLAGDEGLCCGKTAADEMLLTRVVRAPRLCRSLGTWAAKFEATRGSSLEERKALAAEVSGLWKLHRDEAEARALEAEANSTPGSQLTLVLSLEETAVAILRTALMPTGQSDGHTGLLIGAQVDPALSLASVGPPLIQAAREELQQRGVERVVAVAPLPGLCDWIVACTAWENANFDADQAGAVEAIAKGIPRPGHSVLGQGTYKAGRGAIETLAMKYATTVLMSDADAEVAMFSAAGAEPAGVNYMHATDPDSLRDCAGCTVSLRFAIKK